MTTQNKTPTPTATDIIRLRYQALDKFYTGTRLVAEAERELAAAANLALSMAPTPSAPDE